MINKPADVPYCGVRPEVIASAKPKLNEDVLARHYHWMHERYKIYERKDVQKLPAPWTENKILLHHKFTNTRREHDRQSKLLINNICASDNGLSLVDQFWNVVLFRMFNKYDVFDALGGPWTTEDILNWDIESMRKVLKEHDAKAGGDAKWFTNAFNTGGLKQCLAFPEKTVSHKLQRFGGLMVNLTKPDGSVVQMDYKEAKKLADDDERYDIEGWERYMPCRVLRAIKTMVKEDTGLPLRVLEAATQKDSYNALLDVRGFSNFLAYQIWVDLTYIDEYKFSENEFVISGPGCIHGINLLFEDRDGMTHDECIFWLRDNQDELYGKEFGYDRDEFWSSEAPHDRAMNVMQLENSFCELGKYMRCVEAIINGDKPRTRVKYDGVGGSGDLAYGRTVKLF